MILLDTNVVSEGIKSAPDAAVGRWFAGLPKETAFVCAVTEAELRLGVAIMPEGRRRDALATLVEGLLSEDFAGRILPFDSPAAIEYSKLSSVRRRMGRPIAIADAQIAAIARSRGATLATRNIRDFEECGIDILDPWKDPA